MSLPPALAIFDMDRTLTAGAVAHALGDAVGIRDRIKALSAQRDAGTLSQQEVTVRIAALLEGLEPERFDDVVRKLALSPGAEEAVQRLRAAGVAVAICSDSYARAAEPLARKLGIPLWAANVLEAKDGRFTGKLLPWGPALGLGPSDLALDKRQAVPLLCRKAGIPPERTAHIGDGDQDALAMGLVGLGIAYHGTPKARAAARHALEGSLAPAADLVLAWVRTLP